MDAISVAALTSWVLFSFDLIREQSNYPAANGIKYSQIDTISLQRNGIDETQATHLAGIIQHRSRLKSVASKLSLELAYNDLSEGIPLLSSAMSEYQHLTRLGLRQNGILNEDFPDLCLALVSPFH